MFFINMRRFDDCEFLNVSRQGHSVRQETQYLNSAKYLYMSLHLLKIHKAKVSVRIDNQWKL